MIAQTSGNTTGEVLAVVETCDERQWDDFIASHPHASFCHLAGWRRIMEDVLGHRVQLVAAVDAAGVWHAALPLVEVRSLLFGRYLVSMPFLSYGGPVGTAEGCARLVGHAVGQARGAGVKLLELRTRSGVPASMAESSRKVTVTLPLPPSTEDLWKTTFRAKLRSQVRRPLKEGMQACFGPDQVSPFYEVFARNMRDLGTPVLPRDFFAALPGRFPEQVVFGCVWHGDVPVAAGCGFAWNDEFEITWASSLREYGRSAPNMLLYASFMEEMIRRGISVFNFGRCTPGGGTHRFKLQWGGKDEPLPWGRWSPGGEAAVPSPERPAFRLATRMWQRLPLGVANRLGPALARQLP